MSTPEDIDAFFDALVDGALADEEQQQQEPSLLQQQQQQQQELADAAPSGASSAHDAQDAAATAAAAAGATAAAAQIEGAPAAAAAEAAAAQGTGGPSPPSAAAASAVASQPSLFCPADKQFAGFSAMQQQQQQQQQPQEGLLLVPPELRAEPPFAYQPYSGDEEGRKRYAADAEAEAAAVCSSAVAVSRLIESKLKENEQLLFAVHENTTVGRPDEALCYFERLQQNLLFLAMLADQHRGGPAECSLDEQQEAFASNRDFWSHEELQRLHHALRFPGQGELHSQVYTQQQQQLHVYTQQQQQVKVSPQQQQVKVYPQQQQVQVYWQ
ncbi:hypothetical protein Efla_004448 [Eimeria flavescens]